MRGMKRSLWRDRYPRYTNSDFCRLNGIFLELHFRLTDHTPSVVPATVHDLKLRRLHNRFAAKRVLLLNFVWTRAWVATVAPSLP